MNTDAANTTSSRLGWVLLRVVLLVELVGCGVLAFNTLRDSFGAAGQPIADVIITAFVPLAGCVFAFVCLVGAVRRNGWSRAAGFVLQVLTFAVATAMLQHILGTVTIGWWLIALAALGAVGVILARSVDHITPETEDAAPAE